MICIESKPAVTEELQRVPPEQQEPTTTENGKKNDVSHMQQYCALLSDNSPDTICIESEPVVIKESVPPQQEPITPENGKKE